MDIHPIKPFTYEMAISFIAEQKRIRAEARKRAKLEPKPLKKPSPLKKKTAYQKFKEEIDEMLRRQREENQDDV